MSLFGGYNIYREPLSLKPFERIPSPLKKMLLRVASAMPEGMKGKSFLMRAVLLLKIDISAMQRFLKKA